MADEQLMLPFPDDDVQYKDLGPLGFPGYRVGDDGSVWSCKEMHGHAGHKAFTWRQTGQWKYLQPHHISTGYLKITLTVDGVKHERAIHRLVLECFTGPCPPGMECCHGNGNPTDNRLTNLRWDTRVGNQADAVVHGTNPRGERNGRARLTEPDVRTIRGLLRIGTTQKSIAAVYGVCKDTIKLIAQGKTWKHVI